MKLLEFHGPDGGARAVHPATVTYVSVREPGAAIYFIGGDLVEVSEPYAVVVAAISNYGAAYRRAYPAAMAEPAVLAAADNIAYESTAALRDQARASYFTLNELAATRSIPSGVPVTVNPAYWAAPWYTPAAPPPSWMLG